MFSADRRRPDTSIRASAEKSKIQEFGSLTERFHGAEELRRQKTAHLAPGMYHIIDYTDELTKKRNASEKRFQAYGIAAIGAGLFFLVVLAYSIISEGIPAFTRTVLTVEFPVTQAPFDGAEGQPLKPPAS